MNAVVNASRCDPNSRLKSWYVQNNGFVKVHLRVLGISHTTNALCLRGPRPSYHTPPCNLCSNLLSYPLQTSTESHCKISLRLYNRES